MNNDEYEYFTQVVPPRNIETDEYGRFYVKKEGCNHEWQYYQGLFEQYNFCKFCDKKDIDE